MRVQIPAYTDRWMMGDRFGEVVKTTKKSVVGLGFLKEVVDVAHVKLDVSGKTVKVLFDDCKVVS